MQDVFDVWAANEDLNETHHFYFYRDGSLVDGSEPLTDQPIHFLPMLMGAAPKRRHEGAEDEESRRVFLHAALTAQIVPIPSDDRMRSPHDRMRSSDDHISLPSDDRVRPSDDRMRSSDDRMRSSDDLMRSSDDRLSDLQTIVCQTFRRSCQTFIRSYHP